MDSLPPEIAKAFNNAQLWNQLGMEAAYYDQFQAAAVMFQRAIPEFASAAFHGNLAGVYRRLMRYPECIEQAEIALRLEPANAPARFIIGCALLDQNRAAEAVKHLEYLTEKDLPFSRFIQAMALLHAGEIERGLQAYDARLELRPFNTKIPLWNGEPYRHLAIHAEQGFGDAIMFARYLKRLENFTIGVPGPLLRLFQAQGWPCVSMNEDLPNVDYFCPLMSLPNRLGRSDYAPEPYIVPAKRYSIPQLPGFKVGIVWTSKATGSGKEVGKEEAAHGAAKSIPFEMILQLAEIPNVQLYNLQSGEAARDIGAAGAKHLVVQLEQMDFADQSAWIAELDCVVSVDTAPLHLAGAMGKLAIGLLNYQGSWQWQTKCASPWYPSVRLVRQIWPRDWQSCLDQAKDLLGKWAREAPSGLQSR